MGKFTVHTSRQHDTHNQFQDLRSLIRKKADTLCRGVGPQATERRKNMISILVESAKLLKAEADEYNVVEEDVAKVAKADSKEVA